MAACLVFLHFVFAFLVPSANLSKNTSAGKHSTWSMVNEPVRILDCHAKRQAGVRILSNRAKVTMDNSHGRSWTKFLNTEDSSLHMFGIHRNDGQWFFMQPINNKIHLIKNIVPTNVTSNDTRVFKYYFRGLIGNRVIKHIATETYLFRNDRGRLVTTNDTEKALYLCLD